MDLKDENKSTENPETSKQEEKKESGINEIQEKAKAMGWRPEEEWDGPEDSFIDAGEYIRRKPLFDRIELYGKELKEVKNALANLAEHHSKVKEVEFKRALETLKKEKKAALSEGETATALKLDDEIDELTSSYEEEKKAVPKVEISSTTTAFNEWLSKNNWYSNDSEARNLADSFGAAYARSNPTGSQKDLFDYVTKNIKKVRPELFHNTKKDQASNVDTGRQKSSSSTDTYQLTEAEEAVLKTLEAKKLITREKYIAELKSYKGR